MPLLRPSSLRTWVAFHFLRAGDYPDLTYAAENAVKGVVNIVNTQEVENDYYSGGGGFEQFFEFFGMPRGYQQQPQQPRERKSGGSGVIISPTGISSRITMSWRERTI